MSYEPMNTAPRDGSPVLLKPRTGSGLKHPFVGRFHTGSEDWGFAAPVGFGGITDEWLDGWMALPPDGVNAPGEAQPLAAAVDHAYELLRRQGYHRDGDFFVNVNRVGAEAMHVSTVATIASAALITAGVSVPDSETKPQQTPKEQET